MQKHSKQAGVVHVYMFVAIAIIIVGAVGWYVVKHQNKKNSVASQATTGTTQQPPATNGTSAIQQPLGSGSTNQDLNNDVQNLNNSLNQDGQNIQSANQSFSDQQLPVSD